MEKMNELKTGKISFRDRINQIKKDNPGKFDHLPDPEERTSVRLWSEEEKDQIHKILIEKEKELK